MAYRRRNFKRRNYSQKRRFTKNDKVRKLAGVKPETMVDKIAKGVGTVATIAKTVSGIVSLINVEDKFIDTPIPIALTPGAPTNAVSLNNIAQGIDYNQRNGNKILDKCLQVMLRVYLEPTATALATNTVRIVLLIDKKPQIGALTWNSVYIPANDVTGLVDKNKSGDRIVILKDMKIPLNGGNNRLVYKKFYTNLDRIHTQYSSAASTAFAEGQIYLLCVSDVSGLQPAIQIQGQARFCYTDN